MRTGKPSSMHIEELANVKNNKPTTQKPQKQSLNIVTIGKPRSRQRKDVDCKVVHDENLESRQTQGEQQTQMLENLFFFLKCSWYSSRGETAVNLGRDAGSWEYYAKKADSRPELPREGPKVREKQ